MRLSPRENVGRPKVVERRRIFSCHKSEFLLDILKPVRTGFSGGLIKAEFQSKIKSSLVFISIYRRLLFALFLQLLNLRSCSGSRSLDSDLGFDSFYETC